MRKIIVKIRSFQFGLPLFDNSIDERELSGLFFGIVDGAFDERNGFFKAALVIDVKLGYGTVSRFHAVLAYRKGRFFVVDTNSKMGVFVNGVKIEKPTEVFNGDNIAFGNIPMKLLCKEDEQVEPLDEKENRYIESVIADTDIYGAKPKFDTDDIPNVYDGAFLYNETNGERLHLIGDSVIFGRDPSQCDLPIDSPYVSRVHARLFKHDGKWALEDLGSTAGTVLNGQRIAEAHYLVDGDRFSVADMSFVFGEGGIR
jgi:pSer/pThr/pTyr-binding forkhead associated (FHA) protein